ncbi:sigma-70 family RNA polymerase sigma factor [Novosphingobium sp. LASN5T]|uniref:sigma-70 family RNA polymerase sigma factor n=1 Tax=Novosphingobium sp. LASN5T TaxID=2491021 RepID=UPI000F5FE895|nr:sigma-70 family RNA polymerase sigma factor [Novosphingobium sp. LASN5T]RQW43636.1 sigma-70 family RNA polymerase sigma factor [Novosphingobium sp. LASN5T]
MFSRRSIPRLRIPQRPGAAFDSPQPDQAARFRAAIVPHLDAAYTYARYLTRDTAAAEDIVQEAFARALKAMSDCRGNEKAWLMAILRRCHHDWRRARRFELPAEPEDEHEDVAAMRAMESHVTVGEVRKLIEQLPEPFREAIVLRELQELSYREIADITQAPLGTVMSRLARARSMLADLVLRPDEAPGRLTRQEKRS